MLRRNQLIEKVFEEKDYKAGLLLTDPESVFW